MDGHACSRLEIERKFAHAHTPKKKKNNKKAKVCNTGVVAFCTLARHKNNTGTLSALETNKRRRVHGFYVTLTYNDLPEEHGGRQQPKHIQVRISTIFYITHYRNEKNITTKNLKIPLPTTIHRRNSSFINSPVNFLSCDKCVRKQTSLIDNSALQRHVYNAVSCCCIANVRSHNTKLLRQ